MRKVKKWPWRDKFVRINFGIIMHFSLSLEWGSFSLISLFFLFFPILTISLTFGVYFSSFHTTWTASSYFFCSNTCPALFRPTLGQEFCFLWRSTFFDFKCNDSCTNGVRSSYWTFSLKWRKFYSLKQCLSAFSSHR